MLKSLLFFLLIAFPAVGQTTYYFSTSGNDSNNGTSSSSPKKSLSALQGLLSTAQPGDKFLLKRGDTWTTRAGKYGLFLNGVNGTSDNYIVIDSYGTAGNKPKFNFSGTNESIMVGGYSASDPTGAHSSYIKIEDLWLTTTASPGNRPKSGIGVRSYGGDHIIFDSCIVDNLKQGITIQEPPHSYFITIQNCEIRNNYAIDPETGHSMGMYANISNLKVRNCIWDGNGRVNAGHDHNIYLENTNALVENNEFLNCPDGGSLVFANGINNIARGNLFSGNNVALTLVARVNTVMNYLDSTIIEKNIFTNCIGFGRIIDINHNAVTTGNADGIKNLIIRNNVFYNNPYGRAITFESTSLVTGGWTAENIFLLNNTFYNTGGQSTIEFMYDSQITYKNLKIKNNIFYNNAYSTSVFIVISNAGILSNLELNYNLYYTTVGADTKVNGTTRTLAQFKSAFPTQEQNGISANPSFINPSNFDFHLNDNSPAINRGANLSSQVNDDFESNPRPVGSSHDIGAYEYGSISSSSGINVNTRMWLQGPFYNGTMLPLLFDGGYIPLNQTFSLSPWNYNGSESVSSIPNGVIDWVLLELRTDTAASTIVARKAAFLKNNGSIVDLDGTSKPSFSELSSDNYYIIIRHRNHLDVMSANPVFLSSNSSLYDFTTGPDKAYGNDPLFDFGNGIWGMYAGDGDGNGVINVLDYGEVVNSLFATGYKFGDLDLNGTINVLDYSKINSNLFKSTQVSN
jgi:hypothetical protein